MLYGMYKYHFICFYLLTREFVRSVGNHVFIYGRTLRIQLRGCHCKFVATYQTLPYLLTYLLTPWCRVLLEKLTGLQLVKKFPTFYGTRRLITALTSVRDLSLSWTSPIESTYPHPTSWRSILILSTHLSLGLPSGLFPSGFPTKILYVPHTRHMPSPSHSSRFYHPHNIG